MHTRLSRATRARHLPILCGRHAHHTRRYTRYLLLSRLFAGSARSPQSVSAFVPGSGSGSVLRVHLGRRRQGLHSGRCAHLGAPREVCVDVHHVADHLRRVRPACGPRGATSIVSAAAARTRACPTAARAAATPRLSREELAERERHETFSGFSQDLGRRVYGMDLRFGIPDSNSGFRN